MFHSIPVILALLTASPATTDDIRSWTRSDSIREAACLTLMAVDWLQTRAGLASGEVSEQNPLIGPHPTMAQLNTLVASAAVAHVVTAYLLPKPYRQMFQVMTVVVESVAITGNIAFMGGVRLKF